ncbi:MAG TPA: DUF72 domain-containing protein [Acidobacteriota bacterium]|nr:DUF72 domain-containing protein [Acidobacteriota bacterium]
MSRILVGTSGFSYKEWKGIFYPDDLPAKKYLPFYAQHFHTTEINNTFYRIPSVKTTSEWFGEVPDDFSFTLKLSQKITHIRRLKNADQEMQWFLEGATGLKNKLGPVLVQLPPNMKKDLALLEAFASRYCHEAKLAFEFRHDSWFGDDTYDLLRKYHCAFGVVEAEEGDAIRVVTGNFVYMRLRKGEYSREETEDWAGWIRGQKTDVYCYLKHDERAPVLAKQLMQALG